MTSVELSFPNSDGAEKGMLAQELESDLRELFPDLTINRGRERPDSQDFGSTLVLVLGTPVAVVIAKAVADFLRRNSGAKIRISRNGEVVGENLDSSDAAEIAKAFAKAAK